MLQYTQPHGILGRETGGLRTEGEEVCRVGGGEGEEATVHNMCQQHCLAGSACFLVKCSPVLTPAS